MRCLLAIVLMSWPATCAAALVYDADFSIPGQGFIHSSNSPPAAGPQSTAGVNWIASYLTTPATDGSLNEFVTAGGLFRVQDFGGEGILQSNTITLAALGSVDISGVALTIGNDVFNSVGNEGITWFYSLNGGSRTEFFLGETELGGGAVPAGVDVGHRFLNVPVAAGDQLMVGFKVNVNGADDGVEISRLSVDFTATAVPEPSSLALLALAGITSYSRRRDAH